MQCASLGRENAVLPYGKSLCEIRFLLHKETVPHFSCSLTLILQTFTQGKGFPKWLWQEMEVPVATVRAWWYLHVRELLAA